MEMPNIGDITTAPEIGYSGRSKFVWVSCPDCGVRRWRPLRNEITRCWKCSANYRERQRKPLTFFGTGEPRVGDTARASAIGMAGRFIYIYATCPECKTNRWTRMRYKDSPCPACAAKIHNSRHGAEHPRWKGGIKRSRGYTYVLIPTDSPFASMGGRRYRGSIIVAEHRLVVAQILGRPLTRYEVVHHINGIKSDNRPENLQLLNEHEHHSALVTQELQKRLTRLEARLTLLEVENVLLKTILQEVRDSIPDKDLSLRCYNTLGDCLDSSRRYSPTDSPEGDECESA